MDRAELIGRIERYLPWNEQEERDKKLLLEALMQENIFLRENETAHMTASAWTVSPDRNRVLMAYHNLYDSWSWLGGHADGEEDLKAAAVREVREESGIEKVRALSEDIFSLEILTVDGHEKKGRYVSSHLHLNVTYLLEADDTQTPTGKADENKGVAWFSKSGAVEASTEPWFRERIYAKLNAKLEEWVKRYEPGRFRSDL